jgi:hypothetical protein
METNIFQIKKKTKNEIGRSCYAIYTNYETGETGERSP